MKATDELYFQYAGVINRVVGNYARQFPDLKDDLYLQAGLIFCKACESYNPDHPSGTGFGTWLAKHLKSLTDMIEKECHGPNMCIHGGPEPVRTYTIDGEPEDCLDPSAGKFAYAIAGGVVSEYSESLLQDEEYPEDLRAYLGTLQGDALQIFKDFADNLFYIKPDQSKTRAYNLAHEYLTPKKIYMRRYIKLGWNMERTRRAFNNLRSVLQVYARQKSLELAVC